MEAMRQKLQELQDSLDEERKRREKAERKLDFLEVSIPRTPSNATGIATLDELLANLDKEITTKGIFFFFCLFHHLGFILF